eukprot:3789237-Rhodomonas_salina.2
MLLWEVASPFLVGDTLGQYRTFRSTRVGRATRVGRYALCQRVGQYRKSRSKRPPATARVTLGRVPPGRGYLGGAYERYGAQKEGSGYLGYLERGAWEGSGYLGYLEGGVRVPRVPSGGVRVPGRLGQPTARAVLCVRNAGSSIREYRTARSKRVSKYASAVPQIVGRYRTSQRKRYHHTLGRYRTARSQCVWARHTLRKVSTASHPTPGQYRDTRSVPRSTLRYASTSKSVGGKHLGSPALCAW